MTAVTAFEIPLDARPQSFYITLSGTEYRMTYRWNDAMQSWVVDVADASNNPVLSGAAVITGADLFAQYPELQIAGAAIVQTDHDADAVPTFQNLGSSSHVYYVPALQPAAAAPVAAGTSPPPTPPTPTPTPTVTMATTSDPLLAQAMGMTLIPPGNQKCILPNFAWMSSAGFGSLWYATAGSPVSPDTCYIWRINPKTLLIEASINVGQWPANEIRGEAARPEGMWFVDKAAGRILCINPAINAVVCVITGVGIPCYGLCADVKYLYASDIGHVYTIDPILALSIAAKSGGTVALSQVLAKPPAPITAQDTHVMSWDGLNHVFIPDISSDNLLFVLDTDTNTISTNGVNTGGCWGTHPDGRRVWLSEITSQSIAWFTLNGRGGLTSGARWNLPANTGPADIRCIRDEVWICGSTYPNADGTTGAVLVYDRDAANATTPTPKKIISLPGCTHCPSLQPYGDDVFVVGQQASLNQCAIVRIAIDDYSLIT